VTVSTTTELRKVQSAGNAIDAREFRLLLRQMSQAFRDSQGGGLLERCEEISKLLFCKVFDERQPAPPPFPTPFAELLAETDEDIFNRAAHLYAAAIKSYPKTFAAGQRSLSDDRPAVVKVIRLLRQVNLSATPLDVKGVAYEEILRNTLDKTENQQYFTPRVIINFVAAFVDCKPGMIVCDPACGSGGFLVAPIAEFQRRGGHAEDLSLLGLEIDRRMAWLAQMNLLLHGAEEGIIHCIPNGGSLAFNAVTAGLLPDDGLDLILTNPPFGSDYSDRSELAHYETGRGRTSRRRGVLFVERSIRALRPGGRLAIVIEDSLLNSHSNADIRAYVFRHTDIEAVISLPDVAFMPYSTAKTSILLLRKKERPATSDTQGHVFMAEALNLGRKPNGDPLYADERDENGRPLLLSDLPTIAARWGRWLGEGRPLSPPAPPVFICSREKLMEAAKTADNRLDILFYHPARDQAERALQRSTHPVVKLASLVTERNVSLVPSRVMPDDVFRYIGLAGITAFTGEYTVSEVPGYRLKSAVRQFRGGDILFSKLRPELRKYCYVTREEDDGFVSSECYVLTPKEPPGPDQLPLCGHDEPKHTLPEYLSYILRSDLVYGQLVYQITGLGRPRVSKAAIMNLKIPVPPLHEQKRLLGIFTAARRIYLDLTKQGQLAQREAQRRLREAYDTVTGALCPG
jgi:type I restriction-modification system DNA methylase subunit